MTISIHKIAGKLREKNFSKQYNQLCEILKKNEARLSLPNFTLSFGGDGTHYKALHESALNNTCIPSPPVLLVRPDMGRSSGFMSDVSLSMLEKALHEISDGNYSIRLLPVMNVYLQRKNLPEVQVGTFTGDCWFSKGPGLNTVELDVHIDFYGGKYYPPISRKIDEWHDVVKADTVLFFLPLASGAYNRAMGGPLVDWDTPILGVRYLAPSRSLAGQFGYFRHMFNMEITVTFAGWKKETATLRTDWMDKEILLKYGDKVTMRLSDVNVRLLRVLPESLNEKQVRHDLTHMRRE